MEDLESLAMDSSLWQMWGENKKETRDNALSGDYSQKVQPVFQRNRDLSRAFSQQILTVEISSDNEWPEVLSLEKRSVSDFSFDMIWFEPQE